MIDYDRLKELKREMAGIAQRGTAQYLNGLNEMQKLNKGIIDHADVYGDGWKQEVEKFSIVLEELRERLQVIAQRQDTPSALDVRV